MGRLSYADFGYQVKRGSLRHYGDDSTDASSSDGGSVGYQIGAKSSGISLLGPSSDSGPAAITSDPSSEFNTSITGSSPYVAGSGISLLGSSGTPYSPVSAGSQPPPVSSGANTGSSILQSILGITQGVLKVTNPPPPKPYIPPPSSSALPWILGAVGLAAVGMIVYRSQKAPSAA